MWSPPRRLLAALLALLVLSAVATAQDGPPMAGAPVTISSAGGRVKGLHYDAASGGHAATFTLSVPAPSGGAQYVHWYVDRNLVLAAENNVSCTYKAVGVGKHEITVKLAANGGGLYNGALTFAAIGGPIGFSKTQGTYPCRDRDDDATYSPWYLQYFGVGPDGPFSTTYDQKPQTVNATAASQGGLQGGTKFAWAIVGGNAKIRGTPTDTTTAVTVGTNADSGTSQIKVTYTYTDPTDTGLSGSANDDTDEVPAADGQIHTSMYRLHCHGPKTLTLSSKASDYPNEDDVAAGVPNTPSPWNKPHPYGYGVLDIYNYQLKDAGGAGMPNVSVAEGFYSIGGDLPPDPNAPPNSEGGPAIWITSNWMDIAAKAASSGFFSDFIGTRERPAAHTQASYPNDPLSKFTHYYRAGLLLYTGSRGILVLTTTTSIWTNATTNTPQP